MPSQPIAKQMLYLIAPSTALLPSSPSCVSKNPNCSSTPFMQVTLTFTSRDFPEGSESGVTMHRCLLQPEDVAAASGGALHAMPHSKGAVEGGCNSAACLCKQLQRMEGVLHAVNSTRKQWLHEEGECCHSDCKGRQLSLNMCADWGEGAAERVKTSRDALQIYPQVVK